MYDDNVHVRKTTILISFLYNNQGQLNAVEKISTSDGSHWYFERQVAT